MIKRSTKLIRELLRMNLIIPLMLAVGSLQAQTYTFTNAGATGRLGPTQAQVNTEYNNTNLAGQVTVTSTGIQKWVVPSTGLYHIEARGAQGGGVGGGLGAKVEGEFLLNAGDTVLILVGQQGGSHNNNVNVSGGGGTYVVDRISNNILLIAGGGGGAAASSPNANGTTSQNGQNAVGAAQGLGGINGQGGQGASCRGGGGAGWLSDGLLACCGCAGNTAQGGFMFSNGGQGGSNTATGVEGGFGGGGASEGTNSAWTYAGGGGGYSGGGGSSGTGTNFIAGGGGSFNSGTNPVNLTGIHTGHGLVVISLCPVLSIPTAPRVEICFPGTASLIASSVDPNVEFIWYDDAQGITPVHIGDTFVTPVVNDSLVFYVEARTIGVDVCPSLRVRVVAEVLDGPQTDLVPGTVFQGQFNMGGLGNIDLVCTGDTIIYELAAPAGFTNSDFGSGWTISSFNVQTADGTSPIDTLLTAPTATSSATFMYVPSINEADSVFVLNITVLDLVNGCEVILERFITIAPTPQAAFTANGVCLGTNMNFTNTSIMQGAGTIGYNWNFGDNNSSTTENPQHLFATAGNFNVALTATSNQGCTSSTSHQVTVFEMPVADFTVNGNCANSKIDFNNQSIVHAGLQSYEWNFGMNNDTSSTENPSYLYGAQGTYLVTLTVDNNGCRDSLTQFVDVLAAPIASFTIEGACLNEEIKFRNTSAFIPGTIAYEWTIDGSTFTDSDPTYKFNSHGSHAVAFKITQQNGCSDLMADTINVNPTPDASFTYSNPLDSMGGIFIFEANETGHSSYTWNFGDGSTGNGELVSHRYTSNDNYDVSLVVVHTNGCADTSILAVNVMRVGISQPAVLNGNFRVYPNPYSGQTTIEYILLSNAEVKLAVYDMSGRMVTSIVDATQAAGEYEQQFCAGSHGFGPGTYVVRLVVDGKSYINRIVELR